MMKVYRLIIIFSLPLILFISCNKHSSELDYNPNVLSAKDYIRAEDAMFEILNAFLKGINDTLVEDNCYGYIDACEVCYFPDDDLMTFGYGEVNRMCLDNKFRRGSFYATFDGPVFDVGVTASIITDELFVEDSLVEAKMQIQYKGLNSSNYPEYTLAVEYVKIKLQDSTRVNGVSISADMTMVWEQGYLTPAIHEDDYYYVSGSATGRSSDGYDFSVDIMEPLENYVDCNWISKGKSKLTVPVAKVQTGDIDYIDGDGCFNEFHFYFNEDLFFDFLK